jgi:hypothetical protein
METDDVFVAPEMERVGVEISGGRDLIYYTFKPVSDEAETDDREQAAEL